MKQIELSDLFGRKGILCAVEGYKFRIGDLTFEAIEDEDDGYRSMMSSLCIVDNIRPTFSEEVTIGTEYGHTLVLTTNDDNVVLRVGTDDYDDYYPMFVFNWNPQYLTENIEKAKEHIDFDTLLNNITND